MTITLFEAIRALKEGQNITGLKVSTTSYNSVGEFSESTYEIPYAIWEHGKDKPVLMVTYADLNNTVRIIDLPKPKTLREVVVEIGGGSCRTCAWERQSCEKDVNKSCYNGHWLTLEKALASAGVDLEQFAKEAK